VPTAVAAVLPGKEILFMSRTLFLIVFLCAILFAQQPSSEGDETRIIGLENIWNQAQMSHDATAMGSMLHPDFVFTDYDGTVMAKPQFLASIRDSSNTLALEVSDDMKLHRFGDTVVVTGATHEKGKLKGKFYEHYGRFTDTWIRRNGEWLCVASHLGLLQK
jgi:ketosteroid isomerase-like protein